MDHQVYKVILVQRDLLVLRVPKETQDLLDSLVNAVNQGHKESKANQGLMVQKEAMDLRGLLDRSDNPGNLESRGCLGIQ
jgi:hypothetical protein